MIGGNGGNPGKVNVNKGKTTFVVTLVIVIIFALILVGNSY